MNYYANYNTKTNNLFKSQLPCISDDCISWTIPQAIYDNLHKYNYIDGELVFNTNYDLEQEELAKAKEKERIAMLNLTRADVERGIYKAKSMDFEDVIKLVIDIDESNGFVNPIDVKALKIELKANNFYRGNPYVDVVGNLLGFTSEQLDKFFEHNDYTYLLPIEEVKDDNLV